MDHVRKQREVKFSKQSEIDELWDHIVSDHDDVIAAVPRSDLSPHLVSALICVVYYIDSGIHLEDIDQMLGDVFAPSVNSNLAFRLDRDLLLQILQFSLQTLCLSDRRLRPIVVPSDSTYGRPDDSSSRHLHEVSSTRIAQRTSHIGYTSIQFKDFRGARLVEFPCLRGVFFHSNFPLANFEEEWYWVNDSLSWEYSGFFDLSGCLPF